MEPRTDAEVIARSLESPAAFGELFDRHATTMFRYFVRRVGPDDADSLLGELFRIAFEKRAGFDTERAGGATLAVRDRQQPPGPPPARRGSPPRRDRSVGEHVRRPRPTSSPRSTLASTPRGAGPTSPPRSPTLPQGERDTLLLFAWEGMPYDQIAAALDVPVGTVRSG